MALSHDGFRGRRRSRRRRYLLDPAGRRALADEETFSGYSTEAKGSTHRISGAENGRTERACHGGVSSAQADQSISE